MSTLGLISRRSAIVGFLRVGGVLGMVLWIFFALARTVEFNTAVCNTGLQDLQLDRKVKAKLTNLASVIELVSSLRLSVRSLYILFLDT